MMVTVAMIDGDEDEDERDEGKNGVRMSGHGIRVVSDSLSALLSRPNVCGKG